METIRGQTQDNVTGLDPRAVDHLRAIDHPDDAAGEIVFAAAIHPGHLGRFAADQSATTRATGFAEAAQDLSENLRLQFLRADVVEKKKRTRSEDGDVVDAVVDEIGANGVVAVHREGDFQFGADAIDARDQNRLAHPGKIRREKPAETADLAEHFRTMGLPNELVDAALQPIAQIDIHSGTGVGFFWSAGFSHGPGD